MNLKREQLSFMNLSKVFKGILFFGVILLANLLSGQQVSISSIDSNAGEVAAPGAQNTASFSISRTPNPLSNTTVEFSIGGTATRGDDYEIEVQPTAAIVDINNGIVILNFASGGSVDFNITPITDDDLVEGSETIEITITDVSNGTPPAAADDSITINIADNDAGVINFSFDEIIPNPYIPKVIEGSGAEGQFRLESDKVNATGTTVLVSFAITGSAGAIGTDYDLSGAINGANTRITYPDQQQFRVVNVEPIDDTVSEPDETVIITLTGTNNPLFTIGAINTATVTIIDDDCAAGDTAPALNAATAMERCDVASVNLNTFITGGAASAPTGTSLRWSLVQNPTVSTDLIAATASTSNTYYGVYWDNIEGCASPSTQVDLVLSSSPTAGADANGSACNNNDDSFGATAIDLDDLLGAGVDPGTWAFVSGPETRNPNGNNIVQFRNRTAGTYIYSYTTNNAVAPCTNESATFTITVDDCDPCVAGNTAPVLNAGVDTNFCGPITSGLDDYAPNNGPNGTVLRWATSPLTAPVVANDFIADNSSAENNPLVGTYYGYYFDAANSCISPALEISLSSNPIPSITSSADGERCGPGAVDLTATASDSATINWYSAATGGTLEGTGANFSPNLAVTTTYFVEATVNGCSSILLEPRQEVTATVVPQVSAGVPQNGGNASSCSDPSNGPTTLDLDELITDEDEGEWVYSNGPIPNFTIPVDGVIDFEGQPDGNYAFTFSTTGAQAPCTNESSTIIISVNDCDIDTDLDGLFDGPESILGTNPNNQDTDGDGINDGVEVGDDIENPLDEDEDGIIDALDSNIADADLDGVVDQLDPANENPCIPNTLNGVCDTDGDDIPDSEEDINGNGEVDEGESDPEDPCDPNINHPNCNPDPIDLEVLKTVDNINALIGETVVFTITVNNTDQIRDARNIIVGDLLENGFEYQSHSPAVSEYDPVTGEWNIPKIDASSSASLEIMVLILEGGTYNNTAELLDSFPMDVTQTNNSATVTLPIEVPEGVNLVLEKKVSLGLDKEKLDAVTGLVNTIDTEVEVFYFIKVINKSQQDAVSNIRVLDVFTNDDAVDFEIIETNVPNGSSFDSTTGIWLIDGESLEKDEEIELSYRVVYRSMGMVTNTATIDRSTPRESLDKEQDEDSSSTATVVITTRNEVEVGILYNQFSPNNDGLNDDLKINTIRTNDDGTEVKLEVLYNIQIFNRYGNLVFETESQNTEKIWDGSWKGKDAPDGTYFYTLNVQVEGEGSTVQKGWIQLIR